MCIQYSSKFRSIVIFTFNGCSTTLYKKFNGLETSRRFSHHFALDNIVTSYKFSSFLPPFETF